MILSVDSIFDYGHVSKTLMESCVVNYAGK